MTNGTAPDKINSAQHYLQRGWLVVPLHDVSAGACSCGNGDPEHTRRQGGKHPIYANWQAMPLRTPAAVAAVWSARPSANVGIATGRSSGVWVLDTDPDNGGDAALRDLVNTYGPLPMTYQVITGSGGLHHYFAMPPDFEPTNRRGQLAVGLDVRGTGGQVVAPPSVSGKGAYVVALDAPVAQAPRWLLDLIRPPAYEPRSSNLEIGARDSSNLERGPAYARAAVNELIGELGNAAEGTRNETAFRVACRLHELAAAPWSGLSHDEALGAYLAGAERADGAGASGFPEAEAMDVWGKAGRRTLGQAAQLPPSIFGGEVLQAVAVPPFLAGGIAAAPIPPATLIHNPPAFGGTDDLGGPQPPMDLADALIAEMLDSAGLDLVPPLEPLIDGVLVRDSLARIYGPSGHGKSFVALDIAAAVGTGRAWHGHVATAGPVVYLVAEGARGIRKRVRAWERHHGATMTGVRFLPRPVQASGPEWPTLIEACRRLGAALIVIDTQARVTVGVEENSAKETGEVVERMETLRAATGACVLLVHHTGQAAERARGSSAAKAAMQTELGVTKAGRTVTMTFGKQKDADDDVTDLEFVAEVVPLGNDATGRPVDSLVLTSNLLADPRSDAEDLIEATGVLAQECQVFDRGNGATKAEIKSVVVGQHRRMTGEMFLRAWNECVERKILCRVANTSSWRYVAIEDRAAIIEQNTMGAGFVAP